MKKHIKLKGICPHCGSVDFDNTDVQDDGYCTEYYFKCKQCENKFSETYYLDYSHTVYEESNQKHIELEKANASY